MHVPNPPPGEIEMMNGHHHADYSLLVQVGTAWAGDQPSVSPDKDENVQMPRAPRT